MSLTPVDFKTPAYSSFLFASILVYSGVILVEHAAFAISYHLLSGWARSGHFGAFSSVLSFSQAGDVNTHSFIYRRSCFRDMIGWGKLDQRRNTIRSFLVTIYPGRKNNNNLSIPKISKLAEDFAREKDDLRTSFQTQKKEIKSKSEGLVHARVGM